MNYKQKLFYAIGGFFIGNAILLSLFLGLKMFTGKEKVDEINLQTAVYKIEAYQIKEVTFKNAVVILEDIHGNKFETIAAAEPTRESLLNSIKQQNKLGLDNMIKFSQEPAGSGLGWLVLINALPFVFTGIALILFIGAFFIAGKKDKLS